MFSTEWAAVSARIASLIEAGHLFLRSIGTGEHDEYGMSSELLRNAKELVVHIARLQARYANELPDAARQCLFDSIERMDQSFPPVPGLPAFAAAVTLLASFRTEFTHILIDTEAVARSLVARAFAHLQRSIIADEAFKNRWKAVFSEGEIAHFPLR